MHGVEVVPSPAPDEAMLLKDANNLERYAIFITNLVKFSLAGIGPLPIVRVCDIDVDGHAIAVGAEPVGTTPLPPVEG